MQIVAPVQTYAIFSREEQRKKLLQNNSQLPYTTRNAEKKIILAHLVNSFV